MSENTESPYRVEAGDQRVAVVDEAGRQIVLCSDAQNAEQFAVLLNQAFLRGYKAGYRAARRS